MKQNKEGLKIKLSEIEKLWECVESLTELRKKITSKIIKNELNLIENKLKSISLKGEP